MKHNQRNADRETFRERRELVERLLIDLLGHKDRHNQVRLEFAVSVTNKPKEKSMPITLKLTNEQQADVHINPTTDAGKKTKLDGIPQWEVTSGPATVKPTADGLTATIVSDDTDLSDSVVTITADADLGSGVEAVSDTILVQTTHANAKNLGLTADAPQTKPDPTA